MGAVNVFWKGGLGDRIACWVFWWVGTFFLGAEKNSLGVFLAVAGYIHSFVPVIASPVLF